MTPVRANARRGLSVKDRVLAVAAADSTAERGEPATLNDFKS
jgi:hypothetical protein